MHARRLADQALANLSPDAVAAIRTDPKTGVRELGLSVEAMDAIPERGSGGWCDGASFVDEGRIMYRPSVGLRENFTICHELAHHLLRLDDDAMDWVYDRQDPDEALETLCDKFAAALLVPSELVDETVEELGFTADAVVWLYESTSASRHCCAIALVDQMPCPGFAAVVDPRRQEVWVAARKADTSPAAYRRQAVPQGHALHRLTDDSPHIRTKSWWPRGPNDRWPYYLDARRADQWNVAVFTERDLLGIEQLHFAPAARNQNDGDVDCPCGFKGESKWFPCNECKACSCPKCHKCLCDYRAEREVKATCRECFQSVRPQLLEEGVCDGCR